MPQAQTTRTLPGKSLYRLAEIQSVDRENRTIELVWTTGFKDTRTDWFGDQWNEELSTDPSHVRLERLNSGAPLLDTHGITKLDLSGVLGSVVPGSAKVENGRGTAKVRFSKRPDVEGFFQDAADGIIRNVSVGYRTYKWLETTAPDDKIPSFRAVDWEPREISLVPVGFDPHAQTRQGGGASEAPFTMEVISNRSASEPTTRGAKSMDEEQKRAAAEAEAKRVADETAKRAAAEAAQRAADEVAKAATDAELQRSTEIRSAVRMAKLDEAVADDLIARRVSVDAARKAVLEELAKRDAKTPTTSTTSGVQPGQQDEVKTRRDAVEAAILHRFDPKKYEMTEPARQFRGMSLVRMAEELLGRDARSLTRAEIAHRAMTTSDFPLILANTVGRTLRSGYEVQPRTFLPIVRVGTLPDYREAARIQVGDAPALAQVLEHGEYTEGAFGENEEKISLLKYGKILRITEEMIINDDLGAFTRIPGMMGAAAARLESKLVWDIFLTNPAMGDGVALFHATHGNLGTAGDIGETTMDELRQKMRTQLTIDGQDFLDIQPRYLIVGPAKETAAKKMLSAELMATKSADVNVFKNSMDLIVEARITGTLWFFSADPSAIDTIEVAYLEGMAGPQVTSQQKFESDGLSLKVKHVVGVKAIDYRGLAKNAGA